MVVPSGSMCIDSSARWPNADMLFKTRSCLSLSEQRAFHSRLPQIGYSTGLSVKQHRTYRRRSSGGCIPCMDSFVFVASY